MTDRQEISTYTVRPPRQRHSRIARVLLSMTAAVVLSSGPETVLAAQETNSL
jgi:hypothetical protein